MRWLREQSKTVAERVRNAWSAEELEPTTAKLQDVPDMVRAPARGDVFAFVVEKTPVWTSRELKRKHLEIVAANYYDRVMEAVDRSIFRIARRYQPHEVEKLEDALARDLTQLRLNCDWRGRRVECRVLVRVEIDQEVRDALRPILLQRMRMENEHETQLRRAELVEALTKRWSGLLGEVKDDPLVTHAARLSAQDFAEVVAGMSQQRQQDSDQLVKLLEQAIQGPDALSMGAYEWTKAFDHYASSQDEHLAGEGKT